MEERLIVKKTKSDKTKISKYKTRCFEISEDVVGQDVGGELNSKVRSLKHF